MEIYRRIINRNIPDDDSIYKLVLTNDVYRWRYIIHTYRSQMKDAAILYREADCPSNVRNEYRLDGVLDFDPQDLELTDGNSAEDK